MTYLTFANSKSSRVPQAFTLVELLVVIAIIGILVGLLVPALQNMRELSRRSICEQNFVQISLALSSYATQFGHFPAGSINEGGPIQSEPKGYHHNWISAITPMLDAQSVYDAIDFSTGVYSPSNNQARALAIPTLRCPSASDVLDYTTCYAGSHSSSETPIDENNDGVFRLNLPVSENDIPDGLSYTLFVGEKTSSPVEDLGWISGTRSSLRNTGHAIDAELQRIRGPGKPTKVAPTYVGGFSSDHVAGAYFLMGSGEHVFKSSSIDTRILAQLAGRADQKIPSEWKVKLQTQPTGAVKPAATDGAGPDAPKEEKPDGGKTDAKAANTKDVKKEKTSGKKDESSESSDANPKSETK